MDNTIPREIIEKRIVLIRGAKVMLDFHLAELYDVETKAINRAVRRNAERFPTDFCFQISVEEWQSLRYHFGTSSRSQWGGRRYRPFVFTEQGVAMLSSVLKSKRAIRVNVEIMRAFVALREILASNAELARKLDGLEKRHDEQFRIVFEAIRRLMVPAEKPKRQIGFRIKEPRIVYTACDEQSAGVR
ncbi:MAG TPA: ORF6N domain-containing protein [Bacteroidota bacterium]|jgi:phage regulator Rha-like protein